MAKITWDNSREPDVKTIIYEGQEFTAGEPVTTDDERLLNAASHNGCFKVEGWDPPQKSNATVVPPSQQTMKGAVDKPGEPIQGKQEDRPSIGPSKGIPKV